MTNDQKTERRRVCSLVIGHYSLVILPDDDSRLEAVGATGTLPAAMKTSRSGIHPPAALEKVKVKAAAGGAVAVGTLGVGGLVVGAIALGALAIGALAIG